MATIKLLLLFTLVFQVISVPLFCAKKHVPHFETLCINASRETWEPLVSSTWNDLFSPLLSKFDQINNSLSSFQGLNSTTGTGLYKSTEESIILLGGINWFELVSMVTEECKLKLVQTLHCPSCRPCRGYCLNVIHGCFYGLADNLESPWKHAVNSVRTALRLLNNHVELSNLMNTWREPLNWFQGVCEIISEPKNTNCYNGQEDEGTYNKQVSTWTTQFNPEFQQHFQNQGFTVARLQLENITKSLEKYWPQLKGDDEESLSEEDDYGSGSGYYSKNSFETDDEDLINGYSGDDEIPPPPPPPPPISKSSSVSYLGNFSLVFILVYFNF